MDNTNDPLEHLWDKTPEKATAQAVEEEECLDWDDDGEPALPTKARGSSAAEGEKEDGSLFVAICTLCAAIPALIGSWCWPILVGAIFAVAAGNVNGGLVKFFHGVQVAIMFALMTNIVQFAYWNVQKKRKGQGHWFMYQPVYLLMLSTILVLIQPTCMLIIGSWICDGQFSADQLDPSITPCTNGTTGYCNVDGSFAGVGFKPDGKFDYATGDSAAVAIPQNTYYSDGCSPDMQNFFFDGGATQALVPNTTTGWMIQIFGTYLGFATMFVGVCQATMLHVKIARKWAAIRNHV